MGSQINSWISARLPHGLATNRRGVSVPPLDLPDDSDGEGSGEVGLERDRRSAIASSGRPQADRSAKQQRATAPARR